jgi:hypothetical protein
MPTDSEDPSVIRSIAVTAEDVVTATETNKTSDRTAVLRVTPPFSGRMRARLHVRQADDETEAVHIPPATLLARDVPAYPRPAETEDEVRADSEREYSVESHRQYHEQAVQDWRAAIAETICDSASLPTTDSHEVAVHVLGDS